MYQKAKGRLKDALAAWLGLKRLWRHGVGLKGLSRVSI